METDIKTWWVRPRNVGSLKPLFPPPPCPPLVVFVTEVFHWTAPKDYYQ